MTGRLTLAYFATAGVCNGGTEAITLIIEKVRRLAHGFRNFDHYRLRILLAADGTAPTDGRPTSDRSEEPDNAMAESFFAALKNELVHRTVYPTRGHAIRDITRYIDHRYNSRRLHSGLGYRTPNEAHNAFYSQNNAA